MPRQLSVVRNATLRDGRQVDLLIEGEVVADVLTAGTAPSAGAEAELDLTGYVLLTAAADPQEDPPGKLSGAAGFVGVPCQTFSPVRP